MRRALLVLLFYLASVFGLISCSPIFKGGVQQPTATTRPASTSPSPIATNQPVITPTVQNSLQTPGYKDIAYQIDGQTIQLKDGISTVLSAPGSTLQTVTRYFGNEAFGDLNGDGQVDVAFLLTQEKGGSGTFFYVVAALKTDQGYIGTDGIYLGDRIVPQSIIIENSMIVVNYADRKSNEPFTTAPSVGATKYVRVVGDSLMELNPESKIEGRIWVWSKTIMNDGTTIVPQKSDAFTLNFFADGKVAGTTDCNNFAGNVTLDGDKLEFGQLASTMMACEDSQEAEFVQALPQVDRFMITIDGSQLILLLKMDSGSMIFH